MSCVNKYVVFLVKYTKGEKCIVLLFITQVSTVFHCLFVFVL